jgi:hypothetical protein
MWVSLVITPGQPPAFPTQPPKASSPPAKASQPKAGQESPKALELPLLPPKPEGPGELVDGCLEIPDFRVRLAPSTDLELVPEWLLGTIEYGIMRQDLDIKWRMEKRTVTTWKPKVVERRVRVMSTRVLQKGEIDPETGEECCAPRPVRVPVETVMRCQVMEPVTEEVSFRVPVVTPGESPVMVRRHSLLFHEKPMAATRQRAVVFPNSLSLPPCEPGSEPPPDPLGRPESPPRSPGSLTPAPPATGTRGEPPVLPLPEKTGPATTPPG